MKKKITIGIVCAVLVVASIFLLQKKESSTMYEFNGESISANALLDELIEKYGYEFVFQTMERAYLDTLEVTEDDKKKAKENALSLVNDETTEENKASIDESLKALGYKGIKEVELFFLHANLRQNLIRENYSKYVDTEAFIKEYKPRIVTHILVIAQQEKEEHMASKNPTAKEKELMNKIDATLKDSESLKIDMIKLSDGETIVAESLGYVDKNTKFVEPFLSESLKMSGNTLSGWVKTEFGYHRIFVESTNYDDYKDLNDFFNAIIETDSKLTIKVMLDEMKAHDVKLDAEFETKLLESVGG